MIKERITRGKTRAGRLTALNRAWQREGEALSPGIETLRVADIGFGDRIYTTLEWWRLLHRGGFAPQMVGIESDPERVEKARRALAVLRDEGSAGADPEEVPWPSPAELRFVHAAFDLPPRHFRWIRAMNVLRQYREAQALEAHRHWGRALVDRGWLLEGSCDPKGSVLVSHWMQRRGAWLLRDSLLFVTDGSQGSAPLLFGDRLPRDLRAYARQKVGIGLFLRRWNEAWHRQKSLLPAATIPAPEGHLTPVQMRWLAAAEELGQELAADLAAESGPESEPGGVGVRAWVDATRLYLRWTPRWGVPFARDRWIQPQNGPLRALYLGPARVEAHRPWPRP